jgi:hypothetical protein
VAVTAHPLLSRRRPPRTIQATPDDNRNITVSGDRHSKEEDQTLTKRLFFPAAQ